MKKQYTTRLETASKEDIKEILQTKALNIGANGMADYILFTVENIEDKRTRMKSAIKEFQGLLKDLDGQEQMVKEEIATFFAEQGIDRLEGDRVSSITVTQPAPKKKLIVHDKDFFMREGYTKVSLDETKIKNDIDLFDVEMAEMEVVEFATKVKINKRRS